MRRVPVCFGTSDGCVPVLPWERVVSGRKVIFMESEITMDGTVAVRAGEPERRKVSLEKSLMGKVVRRWNFLSRWARARAKWEMVRRFEGVLAKQFEHEWLAGVSVQLRFWPGREEREWRVPWRGGKYLMRLRWMPWREEGCMADWGGPIAAAVYKKGKDGGRREMVRYMGMFVKDGYVHIAQLQGMPQIEMPKGLRDWAARFVRAAMAFAKEEGLKGVCVARAESLYSYHYPYIRSFLPVEVQERELKRIRGQVEVHHNETAEGLGFEVGEEWYVWRNEG